MPRWALTLVLVLAGAGPTVVWALSGGDLITDDWPLTAGVRFGGFWPTLVEYVDFLGRPLSALAFCIQYAAFGSHPLGLFLVLAALNAVVALLVLAVAERLLPRRLAVTTAVVWAVLPNRGSTRLWAAMLPAVLALALLLLAGIVLTQRRGRPLVAGLLIAVATLAYEAVVFVGLAALGLWGWRRGRTAWGEAALAGTGPLLCAGYVVMNSPKLAGDVSVPPFTHGTQLVAAHVGTGTFGSPAAAVVLSAALLARLTLAVVRTTFPAFRPATAEDKAVLAGVGLLLLGALPFLFAGFPFATDGIFDRGNLVADLGTSLFLAGSLCSLLRAVTHPISVSLVAGMLTWLLALNSVDVRNYLGAVHDGRRLVKQLDRAFPVIPAAGVLVVPTLPNRGGVAMFISEGDLAQRLRIARGTPATPPIRTPREGEDWDTAPEAYRYDWRTRHVMLTGAPREADAGHPADRGLPTTSW